MGRCFRCAHCGPAVVHPQVLTVQPRCQSEGVWSACQALCLVASKALRCLETSGYYVLDFCLSPAFCGWGSAYMEPATWGLGISDHPGECQWVCFCRLPPVAESGVSRANRPPHFKLRSRLPACLSTWAHRRDSKSSPRARLASFSSSRTF